MNRKFSVTFTALALLLVVSFSLVAQRGPGNRNGVPANGPCAACEATSAPVQLLTQVERDWLVFMREEEKLAHDVYMTLYEKWKLSVFSNVSRSEQRHFDAIGTLLSRYSVPDPAAGKAVGEFSSPELQNLYNVVVAAGGVSVEAALQVGVDIEEKEIADLQVAMAATDNKDIDRVYSNLLNGSYNHLDAFESHIEMLTVNP